MRERLYKTGGSLDGVGSVTAVDVNADSIEAVVAEGYIDTVIIDSTEITDLQSASDPISISEAIAFQDLKVSNSPTTFYVNDSAANANSNLVTLKSAVSLASDSVSLTGASLSDFQTYSADSAVGGIGVETSFSNLSGASASERYYYC